MNIDNCHVCSITKRGVSDIKTESSETRPRKIGGRWYSTNGEKQRINERERIHFE